MRITVTALALVLGGGIGTAYAAAENHCAKMSGQERAACEKQHAMDHEMHQKGMSEKMRGQGAKEKGRGAEKGNADHDHAGHDHADHQNQGAKRGAKP